MKKFTLLELLIIIAVIGILISILLPSLNNAKLKAAVSVCMNNQAQTMRGLTIFATENTKKDLPPAEVTGEWRTMKNKHKPMGLGYLVKQNIIDAQILYCPSWQHPVAQFNTKSNNGKFGGFHENMDDNPSKFTWTSIAYRLFPDIENSFRPVNLMKDDSNLAVLSDHWTRRGNNDFGWDEGNVKFGHSQGKNYVTSYLSGTVRLKFDKAKALITLSVKHSENHNIEEHWEKYFDIK